MEETSPSQYPDSQMSDTSSIQADSLPHASRKRTLLLISFAGVALIIIGTLFGYYFGSLRTSEVKTPAPLPTGLSHQTTSSPDDLDSTETFMDANFSFKYPSDYTVQIVEKGVEVIPKEYPQKDNVIEPKLNITVYNNEPNTEEEFIITQIQKCKEGMNCRVLGKETYGDTEFSVYVGESYVTEKLCYIYRVSGQDKIIQICDQGFNNSTIKNQILSTFNYVGRDDTLPSDSIKYENGSIVFEYPATLTIEQRGDRQFIGKDISFMINDQSLASCIGGCPVIETTETIFFSLGGKEWKKMSGFIGGVGGNIPQSHITYEYEDQSKFYTFTLYELPYDSQENPIRQPEKIPTDKIDFAEAIVGTFELKQ